jgi:flagellar protein FliO/FliZ
MNGRTALIIGIVLVMFFAVGSGQYAYSSPLGVTENSELFVPDYQEPQQGTTFNPWTSFLRVILGLAIVIGLVFLLRKMTSKTSSFLPQGKYISLVDGVSLGTSKGLYLAKLENKYFLLGVTDHQISLIEQFENEELSETIEFDSSLGEQPSLQNQEFQHFLHQQLDRLKRISSFDWKGRSGR